MWNVVFIKVMLFYHGGITPLAWQALEREKTWDPGESTVSVKASFFTTEKNENTEKSLNLG